MRVLILCLILLSATFSYSQGFNFNCTKDTAVIGCPSSCITLRAVVPDLRASTSTYLVNNVNPTGTCYLPPVPANDAGGASANIVIDDRYSSVIGIGFPFNFFGTTYTQLVISANGYLSFDITKASKFSHFGILRTGGASPFLAGGSGTPEDLPSTLYDKALIMGPYHDLDPSKTTSPDRRVQYQVVGAAPYRRWVLSYYKIPLFSNPCNNKIENTHQIVLYESTGVIEIFIKDMEICSTWNQGRAMVGLQDMNRTNFVMAPGRKASDPAWGSMGMNEVWRFTPASGASLFKRAELYDATGNLAASTTSSTQMNENLELSFPNICTPLGTTTFVLKTVYTRIDNAALEVFAYDTIRVQKTETVIDAVVSTQPSLCSPSTGEILVSGATGVAPLQYALDGGPFQSSAQFMGLPAGDHSVTVKDATGCSRVFNINVPLTNNLLLQLMPDTSICSGKSFIARNISNATAYTWSPVNGVSNASAREPTLAPLQTTEYVVLATLGTCSRKDSILVNVNPRPLVSAGPDQVIIEGDVVPIMATASPGTYLWTPAAGLSSATILNPNASPSVTTTYQLTVTNQNGCVTSDEMTITVFPNCVKPKEAFTPNGDGINDTWQVTNGNCTRSIQVKVFNRYGSPVFSSDNYSNDWDGKFRGSLLPDGTYYYLVTFDLVNGKRSSVKGNVTILR